jgi:molybdenum cofactor biosynthesis enzyme MoaA
MEDFWQHVPNDKMWLAKHRIKDFGKNKNLKLWCNDPFDGCNIDMLGNVFVCTCDGTLPITVGRITDFNSLEEIWSSPIAVELQETIKDGSFLYCDVNTCGILHGGGNNTTKMVKKIFLGIDESCNLQCPSCRNELIFIKKNSINYKEKKVWASHFHELVKKYNNALVIFASGNGDPFASEIYRDFLSTCNLKHNQKFGFQTNGLLLKQYFIKNPYLIASANAIMISIDAGSKDVYEIVRRPGKWDRLTENLDYLHELCQQHRIPGVMLKFVIQQANYKDIPNFLELTKKYNFQYHFDLLLDWYTFNGKFYIDNAVHVETHPDHAQWLELYNKYKEEIDKGLQ